MKSISYIACPYTHPDSAVREYRARLSAWVAGNLVAKGEVVYCPITHGHMMARECDLPTDWEFWMANDSTFFALCDKMYVVKADGWEQSCGVQVEIAMAANVNMPVEYIDPDAFGPWDGLIPLRTNGAPPLDQTQPCYVCNKRIRADAAGEEAKEGE